jgi:hypothetical protein
MTKRSRRPGACAGSGTGSVRLRGVVPFVLALVLAAQAAAQPAPTPYLQSARALGAWLIDITENGSQWPQAQELDGRLRPGGMPGLDLGPAGVGMFFLKLHAHTGAREHLHMAVAAAEAERAQHLRGIFNAHDYLAGAAGSGLFLLAMHAHTGERRFLDWAREVAEWHDRTSLRPAPDERYWTHAPSFPRVYTGVPHGAAGVALFHLALHQRTGELLYLQMAQDAHRWVRRHHALGIGDGDAIGFRRLAADTAVYNWWSGGSAGIMLVQATLYGITGDDTYRDDLRRTADGLLAMAIRDAEGWYWTIDGVPGPFRPAVYSHGNGSIAPALLVAHEYIGDSRYLEAAQESLRWLQNLARDGAAMGAGGLFWPHGVGSTVPPTNGAFLGTASIPWMFARVQGMADRPALREQVLAGADYLIAVGDAPAAGQLRWRNYEGPEAPSWEPLAYPTGWYDGNAGIGLFLLAAHEIATGQRVGLEVHMP